MHISGTTALLTFEEAYVNYGSYLLNNAVGMLKNIDVAEDVVSEVWEIACKKWDEFNQKSTGGWLMTILRNKICDHYRENKRFVELTEQSGYTNGESYYTAESLADLSKSLVLLNHSELEAVLARANGLNDNEAAESLQIKINAFRVRLHKARRKLRGARNNL